MAKFSDQFDRCDPLTFKFSGPFEYWSEPIAWDARNLLKGRTTSQLKQIALAVEQLIEILGALSGRNDPFIKATLKPLNGKAKNQRPMQNSDINLYMVASLKPPAGMFEYEQWEGYAALSLWKLIDFFDAVNAPQQERREKSELRPPTDKNKYQSLITGTPHLLEAMQASTLADEAHMLQQHILTFGADRHRHIVEALCDVEAKRRVAMSNKCRAAVLVRHGRASAHQAEALRLANSKPFKSRAEAARHAADNVEKGDGTFYTVAVVDGWLKAAGWRKDGGSTA